MIFHVNGMKKIGKKTGIAFCDVGFFVVFKGVYTGSTS